MQTGLRLALALLLATVGALLLIDRSGLRADYYALGAPWEGKRLATAVGEPALEGVADVGRILTTKVVFSIRWRGWWHVAEEGEHRFFIQADDGGYLRIDGDLVVNNADAVGERKESGARALAPGFHAVEIGLYQTHGDSRLTLHWVAPGRADESASSLPLADLYPGRPLLARKSLRWALATWTPLGRQLLGALLLLVACSLLTRFAARFAAVTTWLCSRLPASEGRGFRTALLLGLFVLTFLAVYPYTGTVRGSDDTSYLNTATFGNQVWYFNRYAHVYLLKLFVTLGGGDPLVGVRLWWSFVMATTVAALAVAVGSVGPGLQLRTLAVTLFVLLSQPIVFGLIGAGFADFSTMMWITVAVATLLHGLAFEGERPVPRHHWHALALGAVTVAAARSKEVGTVLVVLPMLFLIGPGPSLDLRRFARRMAYWAAGAVGAQLALLLLDGWILGDFLFTLSKSRLETSGSMNFPPGVPLRSSDWLNTLLPEMSSLWLGVCAAAIAAGVRCRRLELRLLHLLPISYLVALIALYIRLPHPFSGRMLIPILPVACLMTGLLLHYAGLDEVPWRRLMRPSVILLGGMAAACVFLLVVPYQRGALEAASVLPVDRLLRYGWTPEHFVAGVLLPAGVLILLSGVALVASQGHARVAALLVVYLALFGVGFEGTRQSLAQHRAAQTGDLLLYPWRTFRAQLDAVPPGNIAISSDLRRDYQMSATTRSSLAHVVLRRQDVWVTAVSALPTGAEAAIASPNAYRAWLAEMPALAETASFDPAGLLVLVRPKEAIERQRRVTASPPAADREKSVEQRLDQLRSERDPAARDLELRWLMDRMSRPGRDRSLGLRWLQGNQLRAVNLSREGWTHGVAPAGLIVDNRTPRPLAPEVGLVIGAAAPEYPIRVHVDDGEQVETIQFDQADTRRIALRPVPPRTTRLFVVWADKAWTPGGDDQRELGVRIVSAVER